MTKTNSENNVPQNEPVEILQDCAQHVSDKKGEHIVLLDLREVNSYLDYFLIVSGNSHVHCRSIAKSLMQHVSKKKRSLMNRVDLNTGWIILDYGDIIIHIFSKDLREFYQLEKLWADGTLIPLE